LISRLAGWKFFDAQGGALVSADEDPMRTLRKE
jgi:hypothetical protein